MSYPSISIITGSYNTPITLWRKTLEAVSKQDYPKSKIEHIIMDAGSPEETLNFLHTYKTKIVLRPDLLNKPQVRMSMAIQRAKGDLILLLEPDNILPNTNWLKQMVRPFMDNKNVTGTVSMYNTYEPSMPLFTKYCALFGINDPVLFYLKKSDKLARFQSKYFKGTTLKECDGYTIVRFVKENLPTLGDNGHMVRRNIIMKVNKDPEKFLHTDAFAEIVEKGYTTFGIVHNSIIHFTGSDLGAFFRRRVEYKGRYYDSRKSKRRYLVYDPGSAEDRKNLLLYIVYSLTLIQPLMLSIRGYMVVPEMAWFLHPVVCLLGVFAYGYSEIRNYFQVITSRLNRV